MLFVLGEGELICDEKQTILRSVDKNVQLVFQKNKFAFKLVYTQPKTSAEEDFFLSVDMQQLTEFEGDHRNTFDFSNVNWTISCETITAESNATSPTNGTATNSTVIVSEIVQYTTFLSNNATVKIAGHLILPNTTITEFAGPGGDLALVANSFLASASLENWQPTVSGAGTIQLVGVFSTSISALNLLMDYYSDGVTVSSIHGNSASNFWNVHLSNQLLVLHPPDQEKWDVITQVAELANLDPPTVSANLFFPTPKANSTLLYQVCALEVAPPRAQVSPIIVIIVGVIVGLVVLVGLIVLFVVVYRKYGGVPPPKPDEKTEQKTDEKEAQSLVEETPRASESADLSKEAKETTELNGQ